ncbi:hypothetical protein ADL32_29540 [Streptomyces albidoflavus]|nr:hypothetical protein ADL32_29540 [Streptomyces albidoflavus]
MKIERIFISSGTSALMRSTAGGSTASGSMTQISSAMSLKMTRSTAPSSMTRMTFSPCGMYTRSYW